MKPKCIVCREKPAKALRLFGLAAPLFCSIDHALIRAHGAGTATDLRACPHCGQQSRVLDWRIIATVSSFECPVCTEFSSGETNDAIIRRRGLELLERNRTLAEVLERGGA